MNTPEQDLEDLIAKHNLQGPQLKKFFRKAVRENWPGFPSFSTYSTDAKDGPHIHETPTSSIGSGAVLTWKRNGVRKVLMGEAGGHYHELQLRNPKNTAPPVDSFTIPGGFITLAYTKGSSLVPTSDQPENAYAAAAREIEEEFRLPDGSPLLKIDPARLKIMDTVSMGGNGNYMTVMGFMYELNEDEIDIVEEHVYRLENDLEYNQACADATINDETNLPEICDKKIFDLSDITSGQVNLLHKDQHSLFEKINQYFHDLETPKHRVGPTLAYNEKVMTLEKLTAQVADWRENTNASIGVTTGVFDILHPGHISFLHDAHRECGRLVVIIASDRTVKEQKGDDKPMINENLRAQSIAALSYVDAIIISDSTYHEEILDALKADIMFKGHDYADKPIYGAERVGQVMIIPCAEDKFFSSSQLIKTIWEKKPEYPAPFP